MGADAIVLIAITALGWATTAGIAWSQLRALRESVNENNRLIADQNGRIGELELWKERRAGRMEALEEMGRREGG